LRGHRGQPGLRHALRGASARVTAGRGWTVSGAKRTFVDQEHQGPRKTQKTRNVEPSLLGCTLAIRGKLGLQRSKLRSTGGPFAFFASFADGLLLLICEGELPAPNRLSPEAPARAAQASGW